MTIKYNETMGADAEDSGGYIVDRLISFIKDNEISSNVDIYSLPDSEVYELVEEIISMIGWWEEEDEE